MSRTWGEGKRRVKRQLGQHAATQVQDLDLPGSVGISEPSFATHLQPLTRCHWSKNNHAGHPSISNGMGNTMHKHTLRLFYIYTLRTGANKHVNQVCHTPKNSFSQTHRKAKGRRPQRRPSADDPEAARTSSSTADLTDARTEIRQADKAEQSHAWCLMRQWRTQCFPLLELQTPNNTRTRTHTTCCP